MRPATHAQFDARARKKPVNVSVNADLLAQAKVLGINLSQALEEQLVQEVSVRRAAAWLAANREALEAYNDHVERDGVFSDGLRGF
jgi:antitoxin CcdA